MKKAHILLFLFIIMLATGCYNRRTPSRFQIPDSTRFADTLTQAQLDSLTKEQQDSADFSVKHHYNVGFNFIVRADSLELTPQQPEEMVSNIPVDSCAIQKGSRIAVTDGRIVSEDSSESV